MVICPICKMRYLEELPTNRKKHRDYHDRIVNDL